MKIFITGIGVVSAIGKNASENLTSIRALRSGIQRSVQYDLMIGEVEKTNDLIKHELNLSNLDYSRTSLLALIASKEAWGKNQLHDEIRTGIISATSAGGMDRMENYYKEDDRSSESDKRMTHDNGRTTERVAEVLGISGFIGTASTACSSGANAIMNAARMMEADLLDRVIAGGSDPLALYNIKGFSSLNIYDPEICKPFDDQRAGLNLGEGAAFLILENENSISKTKSIPICLLSGWNNSTDAFHQTASSANGTGATLAMQLALQKAGLKPHEISYVNAHGTGTGNNDLSESMALRNVFGNNVPPFSSTKGFTGHTLAAAGAIEAVYCVQAIQEQVLIPGLNFKVGMRETGLKTQAAFENGAIDHVLSNSFGFGGNCSCLIFSRIN